MSTSIHTDHTIGHTIIPTHVSNLGRQRDLIPATPPLEFSGREELGKQPLSLEPPPPRAWWHELREWLIHSVPKHAALQGSRKPKRLSAKGPHSVGTGPIHGPVPQSRDLSIRMGRCLNGYTRVPVRTLLAAPTTQVGRILQPCAAFNQVGARHARGSAKREDHLEPGYMLTSVLNDDQKIRYVQSIGRVEYQGPPPRHDP